MERFNSRCVGWGQTAMQQRRGMAGESGKDEEAAFQKRGVWDDGEAEESAPTLSNSTPRKAAATIDCCLLGVGASGVLGRAKWDYRNDCGLSWLEFFHASSHHSIEAWRASWSHPAGR
jgi:hypothetical protein